jgi:hypothetical protein
MASQINPNNINANYPVAGVPNDTQGFRDNFSNIQGNFSAAADEINQLQSRSLLKSALPGTRLDNNMNNNIISSVQLRDVSWTHVPITATSGTVVVDYAAGQYQTITPAGNVSLNFVNWPAPGTVGSVRVGFNIVNSVHTVTLPAAVSIGLTGIQGISTGSSGSNTITFGQTGAYAFEFATNDGGATVWVFDQSRPKDVFTSAVLIDDATASTSTVTGALKVEGGVGVVGNLHVGGSIVGTIAVSGGIVTQPTNKTTGVTLNKQAGEITTANSAIDGSDTVTFTLTNSTITDNDVMVINHVSGGTLGKYTFTPSCGAGEATISIHNVTNDSEAAALVLRYVVIKGATA